MLMFLHLLFTMTLQPELKHKLRILDHVAIYLLIAVHTSCSFIEIV